MKESKTETDNNETNWAVHRDDSLLGIIKKTIEDPDWQPSYYIHDEKKRKNSRTITTISFISVKGFPTTLKDVNRDHVEPIMRLLDRAGYEFSDVPLSEIKNSGV